MSSGVSWHIILGTSCDQCWRRFNKSTSTETRRLVMTDSPGRPPQLSHSSWTMWLIIPWEDPTTPPPTVDAHFYAWLNTHFCHPGVCFFKKLQWSETFGKLQLTSAIVWTHYDFPLFSSFTQRQTWHSELWSRRHCIKSVTVQLLWPVMLHQRLQLKQKTKQKLTKKINKKKNPGTETCVQDGPVLPLASTATAKTKNKTKTD